MNNFKKILSLSVLALVVLAACAEEEKAQEVKTTVQVQPTVTETVEGAEAEEANVSRYGTALNCSKLQQAGNEENCEIQVNDVVGVMLEDEIRNSFDAKRCQELPADIAERCANEITTTGVQGPVSEGERAMFVEAQRPSYPEDAEEEGEPVYDKTKCAGLETSGYKTYCERMIDNRMDHAKLESIFESNDVNRCDELVTENIKQDCKQYFEIEYEDV